MRRAGRQRVGTFTQPQEVKENCARFTPNIWLCREADHASAGGASPDHLRWLSRSANLWAVCKNVRRQFALQLDCPRIISKESAKSLSVMKKSNGVSMEALCPACGGTGFPAVKQPARAGRRIYPAACKRCFGKGRIAKPQQAAASNLSENRRSAGLSARRQHPGSG
jgi:hypothetical protein